MINVGKTECAILKYLHEQTVHFYGAVSTVTLR